MKLAKTTLSFLLLGAWGSLAHAAQTPIRTIDTAGTDMGTTGRLATTVGDIDQDGIADYAVTRNQSIFSEQLWVYSGATGAVLHVLPLSNDPSGVVTEALSPAGDLNNDGIADLLGSHPTFGVPGQTGNVGRIFVLSGLDMSVLFRLEGQNTGERLGTGACMVGDLDQDGVVDYAVSGQTFDSSNTVGGYVRVYSGATGLVILEVLRPTNSTFGHKIACLGDVDSDGIPDLLVGSDGFATFGSFGDGAAWVISGASGNVIYMVHGSPPSVAPHPTRFATNLDAIGDIDSDGIEDFAIVAVNDTSQGNGMLWVFSGATGAVIHQIPGGNPNDPSANQLLIWYVTGAGDVNGDGVPDILGSHSGGSWPGGFTPGLVRVFSGADGTLLMQLDGRVEGLEAFGTAISRLDDVDGDGHDDFLVGIRDRVTGVFSQQPPFLPLDGAVILYSGTCLGPVSYCTANPNSSGVAASLTASGSLSLAANDLVLNVTGAPAHKFGLFFYGGGAVDMPLGDGRLCVGPGSQGLFRLPPPLQTDGAGAASLAIDFDGPQMGGGPGEVLASSSWNFQFWFRDPGGAGGGFSLSNALEAYICP